MSGGRQATPRMTALINTFNYGRFIEEAIASVLAQGVAESEVEVIVVDDGSTDDTRARVEHFGNRVRYVWKPNGGQSSAVNLGYEQARGEIIALLDADDVWLPEKAGRVLEAFDRNPGSGMVLHKRFIWESRDGKLTEDADLPQLSGAFPPGRDDLLRYGTTSTSAIAFRKEAARTVFPIPETQTLHADSYLQALLPLVAPVAILNEPLAKYRVHAGNLYQFAEAEPARTEARLRATAAFVRETRAWMDGHGFDTQKPEYRAYFQRYELIEQVNRFQADQPGRLEFFKHLRLHRKVYRPLWTARYTAFRVALEWLALAAGYGTFQKLRERSSQGGLQRRREAWAPAQESQEVSVRRAML